MKESGEFPEDFQDCVRFHGHLCPGLAIGYAAVKAGIGVLEVSRSEDEEIVAIVENDSCAVDAVQVLLGCTFGKGNLVFRDWGKQVFTFFERRTGRAVRVSLKGITTKHIIAGAMIMIGATRNRVPSTPGGTRICLESSLRASAIDAGFCVASFRTSNRGRRTC